MPPGLATARRRGGRLFIGRVGPETSAGTVTFEFLISRALATNYPSFALYFTPVISACLVSSVVRYSSPCLLTPVRNTHHTLNPPISLPGYLDAIIYAGTEVASTSVAVLPFCVHSVRADGWSFLGVNPRIVRAH